jgi:ribosomal protein L7/L12
MGIDSEYVQRIAALERKVSDLYRAIGREEPTDTVAISPEVEELIAGNNVVEAIKVHREQTGVDLAVAKQDIDNYLGQG